MVKKRKRMMNMVNNKAEPWLSKPSYELYQSVLGFIDFLKLRLKNLKMIEERLEIERRLGQLIAWKEIVGRLFIESEENLHMNTMDLRKKVLKTGHNFVDKVDMGRKEPLIFTSVVNGHAVKILCDKHGGEDLLIESSDFGGEEEYESKFDSDAEEKVNAEVRYVKVKRKFGYILQKSIRLVKNKSEEREIFRGIKCEILSYTDEAKHPTINLLNEKVIIKYVRKFNCINNGFIDVDAEFGNEMLKREFKTQLVLTKLNHPNINDLIDYFETDSSIYSVSRSGGSSDLMDLLANYVKKFKKGLREDLVKKLMLDSAMGLLVAHNIGIAHRDVSLENMVVSDSENLLADSVVQTIDWGHSVTMPLNAKTGEFEKCVYNGPVGKTRYMSPELLLLNQAQKQSDKKLTYDAFKADVFAFGVGLYSMIAGHMPFEMVLDKRGQVLKQGGLKPASLMISQLMKKGDHYDIGSDALDLMDKCLRWNVEDRITMQEVVEHPFFSR